jgi:hypothetical protein
LRWQGAAPDALWHADVCHGPTLHLAGVRTPNRIHGMLDDCSRYLVALEAHHSECEQDMLHVLTRAAHALCRDEPAEVRSHRPVLAPSASTA